MNKRGQFFIFVAIIVALLVFTLITKSNIIREEVTLQNFEQLSQNYLTESPKVINYAIYSVQSPETELSDFSDDFKKYAEKTDPNIGLVYVYNDPGNNKVVIKNLLKEETITFNIGSNSNLLFSTSDTTTGNICTAGTGVCIQGTTNICDTINPEYCILSGESLSGQLKLSISDISYDFTLPENNKGFIVIVKSKEGDTTKVDVSQNII